MLKLLLFLCIDFQYNQDAVGTLLCIAYIQKYVETSMRFIFGFLCFSLLFVSILDIKASELDVKDYYNDDFLEEDDIWASHYKLPAIFKTKNSERNFWDGVYIGATLTIKDTARFKTALQARQNNFKQRSFVVGYNKQFYKSFFNIIVGAEAFIEQNNSSIKDMSISNSGGIKAITNKFAEDSINKGLRLTLGSSFNVLKPYVWIGVYQNSFKIKNVIGGKYNLEYGSALDLAVNSHLDVRVAYKFRNIQYFKQIVTSVPRRRKVYNKVNYNSNNVELGLLLHF